MDDSAIEAFPEYQNLMDVKAKVVGDEALGSPITWFKNFGLSAGIITIISLIIIGIIIYIIIRIVLKIYTFGIV